MLPSVTPIRIEGGSREQPLGKRQQRFNKLVRQVEQAKAALAAWRRAESDIRRDIAEHERLRDEYLATLVRIAQGLDRAYDDRVLTKPERRLLRELLCSLVCDAIEMGGPAELKAIYKRHTQRDFDAEQAEQTAANAAVLRALLEEDLGLDLGDRDVASFDDLQEAVHAQLRAEQEQMAREAEQRRARRKKSARQVASEQRKEAQREQAGKAIQDIYRKLARALHPDHESDAGERRRKTALMQEVNVAYEAKDLLTLLELQLRCEQLDHADISGLADERLAHLNRLLEEQLAGLRDELAVIELPYRLDLDWGPTRKLTAVHVKGQLRGDVVALEADLARARRDADAFTDPRCVKVWLASFVAPAPRRGRQRR